MMRFGRTCLDATADSPVMPDLWGNPMCIRMTLAVRLAHVRVWEAESDGSIRFMAVETKRMVWFHAVS